MELRTPSISTAPIPTTASPAPAPSAPIEAPPVFQAGAAIGDGQKPASEAMPAAPREPMSREHIEKALNTLNSSVAAKSLDLRFGLYNDTNQLYVQVVSVARNQVVKMLPSEDLLKLRETLETAMGLFLDQRG